MAKIAGTAKTRGPGRPRNDSDSSAQTVDAAPLRRSARQLSKDLSSPAKPLANTPGAQDVYVQLAAEANKPARASRVGNRKIKDVDQKSQATGLAPVEEEYSEEDVDANDENLGNTQSMMSGTTAVTTHSATQLSEMKEKSNDLATLLVDLDFRSQHILKLLIPENISETTVTKQIESVNDRQSAKAKMFQKHAEHQDALPYGSDSFIRQDLVLRALFNTDRPNNIKGKDWRPDEILQQANLSKLARQIMPLNRESEVTRAQLQMLDDYFPQPFLTSFQTASARSKRDIGASGLSAQTLDLALELRTQLLFSILRESTTEDPDNVLREVFFEGNTKEENFKLWNIKWPNERHLKTELRAHCEKIRQCFNEETQNNVNFELVEELFPWTSFKTKVASWIQNRSNELDTSIKQKGGVGAVSELVENARAEAQAKTVANHAVRSFTGGTKEVLAKVLAYKEKRKSLEAQKNSGAQGRSSGGTRDPAQFNDDSGGMPPPEDEIEQSREENATSAQISSYRRQKRSLLDEQPDAVKMGSNTQDDPVDAEDHAEPIQSSRSEREQGQPTVTQDGGYEEDEDFEIDKGNAERGKDARGTLTKPSAKGKGRAKSAPERALANRTESERNEDANDTAQGSRKRQAGEGANVSSPRKKRAKAGDGVGTDGDDGPWEDETENGDGEESETEKKNKKKKKGEKPEDEYAEFGGEAPPSTGYGAVQAASQLKSQLHVAQKRIGQTRTFWTEEETSTFLHLIVKYGPSYSLIKERDQGKFLARRDQYALKDKARNMKVDYLLAGVPLPQNFEDIALDKKARDKLEARGVDYEHRAIRNIR